MERSVLLERGRLQIPCVITEPRLLQRVVLSVHGLCGSTRDDIQRAIAGEMSLFDSAVVRFDFPEHGQSPMGRGSFTLENCCDALMAAAEYARAIYPQAEDLCIFATGFGAYITLLCLERLKALPGQLKLVVQTPAIVMGETLLNMLQLSREVFREKGSITLPLKPPLELTFSLLQSLEESSAMGGYDMPMLILHGENDDYIPQEDIRHFRSLNEAARLVFIPGATHRFQESGAWDMVLDLTRDWFEFQQVLLCD